MNEVKISLLCSDWLEDSTTKDLLKKLHVNKNSSSEEDLFLH